MRRIEPTCDDDKNHTWDIGRTRPVRTELKARHCSEKPVERAPGKHKITAVARFASLASFYLFPPHMNSD